MNRRTRARFKTDLTVNVISADLPGQNAKARLGDLSVHGLSLILKDKLPEGSSIRVHWGRESFIGKIIYCRAHGQEFLVGLKVDGSVYETSKKYASQ
jgi:hypothetical protein